jgi:hypothetical protein
MLRSFINVHISTDISLVFDYLNIYQGLDMDFYNVIMFLQLMRDTQFISLTTLSNAHVI